MATEAVFTEQDAKSEIERISKRIKELQEEYETANNDLNTLIFANPEMSELVRKRDDAMRKINDLRQELNIFMRISSRIKEKSSKPKKTEKKKKPKQK